MEEQSNGALNPSTPSASTAPIIAESTTNGSGPTVDEISKDEIALYDRQIRLWGVQAQENIRKANILLISAKALANEIAKNLVLAGIGSLTIIDSEPVTEQDLGAQFLVTEADIGKNRADAAVPRIRKLNPRVKVEADSSDPRTKDTTYFSHFDIIIATQLDFPTIKLFNAASRLNSRPFYAAAGHGLYGYIFTDLIEHEYVIERDKSNKTTQLVPESATRMIVASATKRGDDGKVKEILTKKEIYNPIQLANTSPLTPELLARPRQLRNVTPLLSCFRALWEFEELNAHYPGISSDDLRQFTLLATEKHKELQLPAETLTSTVLRSFLQYLKTEIAPVTAFLGGHLAQDVINVLGKREQPIQNLLLFDGNAFAAPVYALHPIFQDDLQVVNGVNGFTGQAVPNGNGLTTMAMVAGPSDMTMIN
jgi:ubiquitin-like 1-activating enzyme E1 A